MTMMSAITMRAQTKLVAYLILVSSLPIAAQQRPERIISIVPSLTETLFAIGAGPEVVGVGSFDTHPSEVATRPRVGGLLDPDMERIFALRPDLVVLHASQQDQIQQLTRADIPVFSYAHGGLADTLSVIRQLGARTGHASEADRVAGAIEARLADLRAHTGGRTRPRVLLVFGREPRSLRNIYASGGVGFLHDMLEAAGGDNVFADVRRESVQLTSEAILTAAPDVIIELTYDDRMTPDTQAAEVAVWNRLPAIPAVRNGRVYLLLGNQFVLPGPRLAEATAAIAQVLHPDVF
jgi:iron complex transport system substrate-binding protein